MEASGSPRLAHLGVAPVEDVVVNGLPLRATVDLALIDGVLVPALERVLASARDDERTYVFLAAPPATGKSVLAELLARRAGHLDIDAIGIDGFHYPQHELERRLMTGRAGDEPLARYKGAPDTFDTAALDRHLEAGRRADVRWPVYDRTVHDVVADARLVSSRLVVVEGNWLLLDDPRWSRLLRHSSFNVFVDADPQLLRERLIDRKVRGGASRAHAVEFYERSDRLNVQRVLEDTDRSRVDLMLRLDPDGSVKVHSEQGDMP